MRLVPVVAAAAAAAFAFGCSRPEPPTITPEQVRITSITPAGIDVTARLEAYNPNRIDLTARSVKATVTLDGRYEVGTITVSSKVTLPAGKKTKLEVPLSFKWRDVTGLIGLAAGNRSIPYDVAGTVDLGGDAIHFEVPFKTSGTITHDQLVQATLNGLPKLPFPGVR